jgi:AraC family transcriptional regulator
MRRVMAHIDGHLDDDLSLDRLSAVAAFSKYHFHRQFAATVDLSLHRYVQLARLKRAAWQLAYRPDMTIIQVALDAGYDAPDAFARAFRKTFGRSPSAFRAAPDAEPWLGAFAPMTEARNRLMQTNYDEASVEIRTVATTRVAILEHRGDPATIGTTIRRFIAWRRAAGLSPANSATFNVFHSDPRTTAADDYRLDLCAATDRPIDTKEETVVAGTIPGGRCAVLRVVGRTDDLEDAALFLYRHWLPASGEEARDFPLYCQRLSLFPDVPEHEAVVELFLPLQ